jgi:hypothetical protein
MLRSNINFLEDAVKKSRSTQKNYDNEPVYEEYRAREAMEVKNKGDA